MPISLSNIKKDSGRTRKGKRLGRGDSSGKGTYSGRGLKGQKSRAGVGKLRLKRLGMKKNLLKIPKIRGFQSDKPKNQVVNIEKINLNFKDNDTVNPEILWEKGMISKKNLPVKILGQGGLTLKGIKFERVSFSESAKKQIEK